MSSNDENKPVVIITTQGQLEETINRAVQKYLQKAPNQVSEFSERMDRKQAARFLGIQYASMYNWVRDGKIREHGIGRKRFYYKNELIQALENAETEK